MLPANTSEQMRASLRELFLGVLAECAIPAAFSRHVQYQAGVLRVRDDLYSLADYERVSVISIGKAAHSMLDALVAQIGEPARGIVVGVTDPVSQHRNFRYFTGGHPLPTAESLTRRPGRSAGPCTPG